MKILNKSISYSVNKISVLSLSGAMALGVPAAAWAVVPVEVGYDLIEFINPETDLSTDDTDDIGANAQLGDTVSYENVFPGVSAQVTVNEIVNLEEEVDKIDEGQDSAAVGFDDTPLWVEIDPPGVNNAPAEGGPGSATFTIDFFVDNGEFDTPVALNEIGITVKDIDEGQSITFNGASTYSLSSDPQTNLVAVVENGNVTVSDAASASADAVDEEHWVAVTYETATSITFTVGAVEGADAEFGLLFTTPDWSAEPTETTIEVDGGGADNLADTGLEMNAATWGSLGLASVAVGAVAVVARRRRTA